MRVPKGVCYPSTRRHFSALFCTLVALIAIISLLHSLTWTMLPTGKLSMENGLGSSTMGLVQNAFCSSTAVPDLYDPTKYVKGPPTHDFRDNLLPDIQYITSWISAGWTNDVMSYINLIYLGILTGRVPIIPMFVPSHHIGGTVPSIDFGEVFDIPRLRTEMNHPLLEWREVKKPDTDSVQTIGCWNTWGAVRQEDKSPRWSSVPERLNLDISYTMAPSWIKRNPLDHDAHASFASLSVLAFPEGRLENAVDPEESPLNLVKLLPDEHLLCYDFLYFVCSQKLFEMFFDYSPAWLFVGRFMHWAPELETLAIQYVRKLLEIDPVNKTPPWIGIHIRHGDFAAQCGEVPIDDCFAPILAFSQRVDEVKQEILDQEGVEVQHVIVTSDEKNTTWWEAVSDQGWYKADSSEFAERYGAWYPVLIDAVIQSGGLGFVGTDGSTMSLLGRRRVQSWRNGSVRTVKWGRPGADNH